MKKDFLKRDIYNAFFPANDAFILINNYLVLLSVFYTAMASSLSYCLRILTVSNMILPMILLVDMVVQTCFLYLTGCLNYPCVNGERCFEENCSHRCSCRLPYYGTQCTQCKAFCSSFLQFNCSFIMCVVCV